MLPAPPEIAPESGPRPADAGDVLSPLESDAVRAVPDGSTERDGWAASTPILSSAGDGEVDEILADLKDAVPAPVAGPSIVAP
ncbi:MAG TPA: hypothetical protein VE597_09160, partial [Geminicoccaceae bacterium]|nr:hypothetical protein [Geminicoccaceae bacterium]